MLYGVCQFAELVAVLKTMLNLIEQQRRDKMITELPDAETLMQRRRCVIPCHLMASHVILRLVKNLL